MPSALLFNRTANIVRPAQGRSAGGAAYADYAGGTLLFGTMACAVQPSGQRRLVRMGAEEVLVTHAVYTATDVSGLRVWDRIEVSGLPGFYLVIGPRDQGGRGRVWAVDVTWRATNPT